MTLITQVEMDTIAIKRAKTLAALNGLAAIRAHFNEEYAGRPEAGYANAFGALAVAIEPLIEIIYRQRDEIKDLQDEVDDLRDRLANALSMISGQTRYIP